MKRLIFIVLLLPFAGWQGRDERPTVREAHGRSGRTLAFPENVVEVRGGAWPINLERNADGVGTYSLIYRNQEVMNSVSLDTLTFADLGQLNYFAMGLDTLKVGHDGDIVNFKNYSIKRTNKKFEGIWYLLRYQFGSTSFRQPEADIMRKTIRGL